MRVPRDAVLPDAKIDNYLLVTQERDDKSGYLAQAGFTPATRDQLRDEILRLSHAVDAEPGKPSSYGTKWIVTGRIKGPDEVELGVSLVWMQDSSGQFKFITLVPA